MKTKRTLIALVLCTVLLTTIGCAAKSSTQESISYAEPASGTYDMAADEASKATFSSEAAYSGEAGQRFHAKLDTHSRASWTVGA